jgi:hypothetical protein
MMDVIGEIVRYMLPLRPLDQVWVAQHLAAVAPQRGVRLMSLLLILISCTGIFLPLEVALNRSWGVAKSRNYLMNQLVALGLAMWMVLLGLVSVMVNAGQRWLLAVLFFGHTDNLIYHLLAAAQPQAAAAARAAGVGRYGAGVGGGEVSFCCAAAAAGFARALWAVLGFRGLAALGLCVRAVAVCRSTIQRYAASQPTRGAHGVAGGMRRDEDRGDPTLAATALRTRPVRGATKRRRGEDETPSLLCGLSGDFGCTGGAVFDETWVHHPDEVSDGAMDGQWMAKRRIAPNAVPISAAGLRYLQHAAGGQVIHDALHRAFGNAYASCYLAHAYVRPQRDDGKHVGMVG